MVEAGSSSFGDVLFHCKLRVQIDAQTTDDTAGLNVTGLDLERLVGALKFGKIGIRPKPDRLCIVNIQLQSARGTPLGNVRHTPGQTVSDKPLNAFATFG